LKNRIVIAVLCCALSAALLCACGKTPAEKTGAPSPEISGSEGESAAQPVADLIAELDALQDIDKDNFVRNALNADAFATVLASDDKTIRLRTDKAENVVIPAGDYTGKTIVFEAANSGVVSNGDLGTVIVDAIGEEGLTLNGSVKTLAVYGVDAAVNLNGGADTLYVRGQNCLLRLTGGTYGKIISVNQTVLIENLTENDVTVYMANGVPQVLAAGETLHF
jgi:hypothetical protein